MGFQGAIAKEICAKDIKQRLLKEIPELTPEIIKLISKICDEEGQNE